MKRVKSSKPFLPERLAALFELAMIRFPIIVVGVIDSSPPSVKRNSVNSGFSMFTKTKKGIL